jgi:hypothetical protein
MLILCNVSISDVKIHKKKRRFHPFSTPIFDTIFGLSTAWKINPNKTITHNHYTKYTSSIPPEIFHNQMANGKEIEPPFPSTR